MAFRALVLHLDDVPDLDGDTFHPDGTRLATGPVPVYLEFNDRSASHHLGYAKFERVDDKVYANIEFNTAWSPSMLAKLTPAVGGRSKARQFWYHNDESGLHVYSLTAYLNQVGLCFGRNLDRRILSLTEQGYTP